MHVPKRIRSGLAWLAIGLLSLQSHALTLGDLAVSSSASPSFTASLPFSDDKPVRISELQTRLATDAEYAQWGLQIPPVIRELRVRVVPASQAVGYVEMYSVTPLSQSNFDLVVWASYAGQTMLTHYKVGLQDAPSLIKGRTLSSSQAISPVKRTASSGPASINEKPHTAAQNNAVLAAPAPVQLVKQDIRQLEAPPTARMVSVAPTATTTEHRNSNPVAAAVNGAGRSTLTTPSQSSGAFSLGSLILMFSLVLFLFGFLLGRQRQSNGADHTPTRPVHPKTVGASMRPSMPPKQRQPQTMHSAFALQAFAPTHTPAVRSVEPKPSVQPFQAETPAPPIAKQAMVNATVLAESYAAVVSSPVLQTAGHDVTAPLTPSQQVQSMPAQASAVLEIDPTPMPSVNPISSMALASRPHTTALPTPRRSNTFGHLSRPRKAKSAGDSNIDLAKIYLSMGDPTTAQMVLRQVLEEGSDAEKAIAEQLMQEMA